MAEPSLPELEAERDRLYAQLSAVGDFRRGSVSENYRKCGKPNCGCAPRIILATGRGSCGPGRRDAARRVGRQLAAGRRWRRCGGRWPGMREFAAISERIAEVNEKICEARPAAGSRMRPPAPEGEKGGSASALAQEKAAEIGRLAAEAARSLGCGGAGLEAAEAVIRAGMLQAGLRHAGGAAGRRSRLPRPAGAVRPGP